jgi:DNA polymerase I-like protein with 3'-5' exonuclease and polymerase domains/uracil-DNA glycosylase
MSFFYNETKVVAAKKPAVKPRTGGRGDIPIASLQKLGCSGCPRNEDPELKHPKIAPDGAVSPSIYLLGSYPNKEDDERGYHWSGSMGIELIDKFGRDFMRKKVRSGFITQCAGDQTVVEIECCRNRVIADIEESKPLIVVGIGDEALRWATGVKGSALVHRGTLFNVKIGRHICFYYPLLYPAYLHKKSYNKSEYELTMEHDVARIKALLADLPESTYWDGAYDGGIELITGNEPNDMVRLEQGLAELAKEANVGVDIETNGLRVHVVPDPKMWTVAVGTFNRTIAFPLDHPDGWGTEARKQRAWGLLGAFLLGSGLKAAHNLAFEFEWFHYFYGQDIIRKTDWDDTMAMAHTFDERPGSKSLDVQTRIHFGFGIKSLSNLDASRIVEYPLKQTLKYNALDTKWTDKLRQVQMPRLYSDPLNLAEYERKVRLAGSLVIMEAKGLPVDFDFANAQSEALNKQAREIEGRISRCPEVKEYRTRFGALSPTNPDQVLKLLKEICQRDEIRVEDQRTKVVRWTTDEEALNKIPAKEVPSAPMILEHRAVSKLLSTYVRPIVDRKIVCRDGRIRCKYSSMVAVTGRLASEDPNIQNWPARKFREIRGIVTSEHDGVMLACDYGQIEFRVVGMASEDKNLVRACWTGYDVHKFWAERMVDIYGPIKDWVVAEFGVDWDEKGIKTLRQETKNKWVFPQLFGSSLRSCAEQLHLPDSIAERLGEEFWDEFSGVKKWQEKLVQKYEKNLYVETLGGRRRRGPMTKNEIINMPIQGTAADIVTAGQCIVTELAYELDNPELVPNLNVHDDLTFLIRDETLESNLEIISREMCKHRFNYINVPLVVEAKIGLTWNSLEEIKVYRSDQIFNLTNPYL